jgi:hypothetical protein
MLFCLILAQNAVDFSPISSPISPEVPNRLVVVQSLLLSNLLLLSL